MTPYPPGGGILDPCLGIEVLLCRERPLFAAAAREPEATEQGSTVIRTRYRAFRSAFLQNAKDCGRAKIKGTRDCG